jgi:uncharacterized protein
MSKNNALLVFVKNPELGKVKTRLKPELSNEECVAIYKAMVNDLVKNIQVDKNYDIFFFFTPKSSVNVVQQWLGYEFNLVPQSDGDLGKRMSTALIWAFENNYQKAVLIGSDCPTMDQKLILNAFKNLENSDVVLGPSEDGGYYLVGTKSPQPEIFENIHWSSDVVFSETILRIKENNRTYSKLEIKSDIDKYSDLVKLNTFLKTSQNGFLSLIPETGKMLGEIINKD